MGQYYRAVCIDKEECVRPYGYDAGAKLTEHSWVRNSFVGCVMKLMSKGGDWHKTRVVWAGDYWGESHGDTGELAKEWYDLCDSYKKRRLRKVLTDEQKDCYLVNHSKKLYVSYNKLIGKDGWIINPLPILTALGNGRGGGDYHGQDEIFVGTWAGDVLSIEQQIPKDFKEMTYNFTE